MQTRQDYEVKNLEEQPAVIDEQQLEELRQKIQAFNTEQLENMVDPNTAVEMTNPKQDTSPRRGWEKALTTDRKRALLLECRNYRGSGLPGHALIELIQEMAEMLDEGA